LSYGRQTLLFVDATNWSCTRPTSPNFTQRNALERRLLFGHTTGTIEERSPSDEPRAMSTESRLPESCRDSVPRELIDLGRMIAALPEGEFEELSPCYSRVVDGVKRRRRILALVQEALSQLRLDIKYLMFDLEITRQERDALREELDRIEREGRY
jgi:hypothetical protein